MLSQVTCEFCAPHLSQRACFDSKYDFASHFAHFRDVLLTVDSDNLRAVCFERSRRVKAWLTVLGSKPI
jgi:hypothetical protein